MCFHEVTGYEKPTLQNACTLTNGKFHQRCEYEENINYCKTACDGDNQCKGYVLKILGNIISCQTATTSNCAGGGQPKNVGNVGDLDPKSERNDHEAYQGCFIKQSCKTYYIS